MNKILILIFVIPVLFFQMNNAECDDEVFGLPFQKIEYNVDIPYNSITGKNSLFTKTFEDGTLNGFSGIDVPDKNHIGLIDRNEPGNKKAVWFSVTKGQPVLNGGMGSEITWDNRDPEGSVMWYGWSVYIPADFKFPSDYNLRSRKPWIIMGQWNAQQDPLKDETRNSFLSNAPVIAYGFSREGIEFKMLLIYGNVKSGSGNFIFTVKPGQWNRIVTKIKWSTAADGIAETYLNGYLSAEASGPNMNNHFPHYLKIGLYRDRTVKTDNVVFYDDIKIGFKKSDVE